MPSDEFLRREFEKLVETPAAWWTLGDRLRIAARTLFGVVLAEFAKPSPERDLVRMRDAVERWSPACLLAGLAIENYAKGLVVQRESLHAKDGKVPSELTNHNLRSLLKRAGIEVVGSEVELIHMLHEALVWRGRYPMPTSVEAMSLGHFITSTSAPRIVETFERLCDRCEAALGVVRNDSVESSG